MAPKKIPYDAILIDTSTFENHHLKFDAGLLASLTQFKRSPVELLLPDVIKGEIENHLTKKINQVKAESLSKFKNADEYLDINPDLSKAYYNHINTVSSYESAKIKIDNFIKNTGANVLIADEHLSISNILKTYFACQPPFQDSGSKKNEFPDAIALFTAENWAKKNKKKVLVVSSDNDWEDFCKNSKRLTLQKNLAQALDLFNKINTPHLFAEKLEEFICRSENNHIRNKVLEYLETTRIDRLQINADSHLDWHLEESTTSIQTLYLIPKIQIIRIEKTHITVELSVNLELEITARFMFTLGDYFENDLKLFGGTTKIAHANHVKKLLVDISTPLRPDPEDLTITNIQSERHWDPIPIDFGKIEPSP
ncbi:MAG TPA: PIN domain-containing protein [Cellvibrio sp.]|nr:PIN domain-containing protein [Cellvibrio sp.]